MTLTSDGEKLYQYALQRNYLEQALRQDLKMQNNAVAGDLKLEAVLHLVNIVCHDNLLN